MSEKQVESQTEMQSNVQSEEKNRNNSIFSVGYWRMAAKTFASAKMLAFAAVICALRIAIKALKISIEIPGMPMAFDCYVNSLGSLVYGPLMGLLVGAVSDTLGAVLFPSGPYFFPFIFVEMSSSFIFGLFFWKRKITTGSAIFAKFTVNFICNIILTSIMIKWSYIFFGTDKAFPLINGVRIVKNLILFPLEGILICLIFSLFIPALKRLGIIGQDQKALTLCKKDVILTVALTLAAIGLILFYVFFFKDFMSEHNFKFF